MNRAADQEPSSDQHLDEEQLTQAYYGDLDLFPHLCSCAKCWSEFDRLTKTLDAFHELPVPDRGADYGSAVWNQLLPKLEEERRSKWIFLRWHFLVPAFAVLLIAAFLGGRLVERNTGPRISQKSRERVLMMSLSEHLDQAQIVLANVANTGPDAESLGEERDRAHELLGANRLLRQTAVQLGDMTDASLLDELERVLMLVANSRDRLASEELEHTQQEIEQNGLLFRVRVTSATSRERGEKL